MKKLVCTVLILLFVCSSIFAETVSVPQNVKMISQSCASNALFVSVIDLDNNEIVIIAYHYSYGQYVIQDVVRTGMFVDPKDQMSFKGTDAPFSS